jgi:hypothetical protein
MRLYQARRVAISPQRYFDLRTVAAFLAESGVTGIIATVLFL